MGISCNQLRFRRWPSCDPSGYCEIATSAYGLFAMTNLRALCGRRCQPITYQPAWRSLTAATVKLGGRNMIRLTQTPGRGRPAAGAASHPAILPCRRAACRQPSGRTPPGSRACPPARRRPPGSPAAARARAASRRPAPPRRSRRHRQFRCGKGHARCCGRSFPARAEMITCLAPASI